MDDFETAVEHVTLFVAQDRKDCRKKFGDCWVEVWPQDRPTLWEVRAGRDKNMPMWSRYTIHEV
jgi:hypothetical protein